MGNKLHKRVAVAMSGGVDSSVAAALLRDSGVDVIGFTMRLGSSSGDWEASNACCGLAEIHDARRVADTLGIPHYVLNHAEHFEAAVIADFVDEYARGRTPNPCVRCNQHIKFDRFLDYARVFDCDAVATGHYARTWYDAERGRHVLARGRDADKDQSYVLHPLTQEQLAATVLPLGELTKGAVRELAGRLGLVTADKPESQEICFVENGGHAAFVAARRPAAARPGPILGPAGERLGTHRGIAHYTVGQRKGLGLATAEPMYVTAIRADDNAVLVAPAEQAGRRRFEVENLHWVSRAPVERGLDAAVQVRYRMRPASCRVQPAAGARATIDLAEPMRGISPGQSAVVYDGDQVVAGGTIDRVTAGEERA